MAGDRQDVPVHLHHQRVGVVVVALGGHSQEAGVQHGWHARVQDNGRLEIDGDGATRRCAVTAAGARAGQAAARSVPRWAGPGRTAGKGAAGAVAVNRWSWKPLHIRVIGQLSLDPVHVSQNQ